MKFHTLLTTEDDRDAKLTDVFFGKMKVSS